MPRAETAGPSRSKTCHGQHMGRVQCVSLQIAEKHPLMKFDDAFWAHFGSLRDMRQPNGVRARAHSSSPFRRFGAIFGVPNAYRDLYIDLSFQTFHHMPLRRSPVSSRDLASSGLLCMPTKEVRRSGYADTLGSGSALRRHVRRGCSGPYCGTVRSARNRPRGLVGPRGGFAPRPQPTNTHGRAIELEGGGGARRGEISVH